MVLGDAAERLIEAVPPPAAALAASPVPVAKPRRPVMRQYELVERVKAYDPDADEDLLNRAYVFAMKAHGSQLRASGDPYFHHPVEVAGILTGFKLDSASIATALLHDTVEDTGATLEEIERLFGRTVARLVSTDRRAAVSSAVAGSASDASDGDLVVPTAPSYRRRLTTTR